MDPALKQRLVGAAVLVALAVIFVPMLLEAPEPEATPAGQLPLDVPESPSPTLQTRDVPLTLPQPAAQPVPSDPNAVATVDVDAAPRIDALDSQDTAQAPTPAPPAPAPAAAPEPLPAAVPAAPTPRSTEPQSPPPPSRPALTAPAPATPAPASAASVAPASGRYVVNLGSYGNIANAEALNRRLAQRGYPIRSERIEVDGKPAQRLRAGPFRTRAEAEAAALKLNQAEPGARFSVGELESAEPVAASAAAPRVPQGFAVQVGAFKDESEATALRERLRKAGFAAYTERASTDAGALWRVRAGPELQRDRAEQLRNRIKDSLKLDGLVVSHP